MKSLAKLLQMTGLIVPPLAIFAQLSHAISVKQMLLFLVAAVSAFLIGRLLEGYTQS